MIKINLLPNEYLKKQERNARAQINPLYKITFKTWLVLGGAGASCLVILVLVLALLLPNASLESRLKKVAQRETFISKSLKVAIKLDKEEELLKRKVTGLKKFKEERIQWSAVLNDISDATPLDLRLTSLYVKSEGDKNKSKAVARKRKQKRKGAKDKTKSAGIAKGDPKFMIRRSVILEGVIPEGEKVFVVNGFIENLRQTPYLSSIFSEISLANIRIRDEGSKQFQVICDMRK